MFARLLDEWGVIFEYERRDPVTGGYPDFYIMELDIYIEIHPDCWIPKSLPDNAILLVDMEHALPVVVAIASAVHGVERLESVASLKMIDIMQRAIDYIRIISLDGMVADYSQIRKVAYLSRKNFDPGGCAFYAFAHSVDHLFTVTVSCDLLGEL